MIVYERPTGPPTGKCMPGAQALMASILFFDGNALAFNGCYNNRNVRGGTTLSCHAEGRAIDFNARTATGNPNPLPIPDMSPADKAIKKWMWVFVATSDKTPNLGVQRFIYKRTVWTAGQGSKTLSWWSPLAREHQQHIHIELTKDAAAHLTAEKIRVVLFGK